jgi:hypothetical protein
VSFLQKTHNIDDFLRAYRVLPSAGMAGFKPSLTYPILSRKTVVHFAVEQWYSLPWNGGTVCRGMVVQFGVEYPLHTDFN